MSKLIVNVETGEVTERQSNKIEIDQQKIDEAEILISEAEAEKKATAKAALLSKLGISESEAALLLS
jgi:hypothetical protein